MRLQFTIFLILVNSLLYVVSISPSTTLPYGCVECQNKGGVFCGTSTSQFCSVTAESCVSNPSNKIIPNCANALKICADFNHNCDACTTSTLGCKMCLTNQDFCIPKNQLLACYGETRTDCSVTPAITAAYNCMTYTDCATCTSNSCFWSPIKAPINTVGCMSKASDPRTFACSDPVTQCAPLGGTFESRCNCTANPNCGVCYGITDTITNYFCSSEATSLCQTNMYSDCNAPELICPILINPYDPYDTVCQCSKNPQCTICLTVPTNDFTPPQLKCVSSNFIPPRTCQSTTTDCNDKKITCPKLLSCSNCVNSGCTWCDTNDVASTPTCRAPTDQCPNSTITTPTCRTTPCSSFSDCDSCNNNNCHWCYSGESGKSACLSSCSSDNNQTTITQCSKQDSCALHKTCSTCLSDKNCSFCEGLPTFTGRSPGFYCTSLPNCGKTQTCGVFISCVAEIITNCSITDICPSYKDCISCNSAKAAPAAPCSWCSNNGVESCNFGCSPGFTVPSCAVYGPTTTTGWPVYTPVPVPTGGTGAPGSTPSPPPTTSPDGTIIPGGTPSGNTGAPTGGNTPGGTGNTPGGTGTTPGGTTPGGTTPGGTTPGGTTPGGTTPGGKTPGGNTPGGNTPGGSGNTPGGTGNTPGGNTPGGTGNTPGGSGNTPGGMRAPDGTIIPPGGLNPDGTPAGGMSSNSTTNPAGSSTNKGITGDGTGVVNGFDFVLFGIIVAVILVVIIIIVIVVVVVKGKAASETV